MQTDNWSKHQTHPHTLTYKIKETHQDYRTHTCSPYVHTHTHTHTYSTCTCRLWSDTHTVRSLISHRERKSNHTDTDQSNINKTSWNSNIHTNYETFKRAQFPRQIYSILPKIKSYRRFITKPINAKVIDLQYKNTNSQKNYREKVVLIPSGSFLANISLP